MHCLSSSAYCDTAYFRPMRSGAPPAAGGRPGRGDANPSLTCLGGTVPHERAFPQEDGCRGNSIFTGAVRARAVPIARDSRASLAIRVSSSDRDTPRASLLDSAAIARRRSVEPSRSATCASSSRHRPPRSTASRPRASSTPSTGRPSRPARTSCPTRRRPPRRQMTGRCEPGCKCVLRSVGIPFRGGRACRHRNLPETAAPLQRFRCAHPSSEGEPRDA
jgi:hypothetical protein